jgi:hypothetical protein
MFERVDRGVRCIALLSLRLFPLLSPCLYSFTRMRYWNSYQVSIPIFSSLSSLAHTSFSLPQSLSLSASGRLFLRHCFSCPFHDFNSSIIPRLLEKGSISLVYERADVQFALSCHELQCTSVTNIFSWPFQARMYGNCAFWRSVDFKCRLQAYQMFGYLDIKKLNAFRPKRVCLFCKSFSKGRAAYWNMFYPCRSRAEITAWLLFSQPIIMNTKQLYFKTIMWSLHTVLTGSHICPIYLNNEVFCGFHQPLKANYLGNLICLNKMLYVRHCCQFC